MGRGGLGLSVSESSESATTPFFEVDSFVYFDLSFLYYSEKCRIEHQSGRLRSLRSDM